MQLIKYFNNNNIFVHSSNGFLHFYHFHLSNYIQNILLYYKLFTILETQHQFKTHSTHNITITYILITKNTNILCVSVSREML